MSGRFRQLCGQSTRPGEPADLVAPQAREREQLQGPHTPAIEVALAPRRDLQAAEQGRLHVLPLFGRQEALARLHREALDAMGGVAPGPRAARGSPPRKTGTLSSHCTTTPACTARCTRPPGRAQADRRQRRIRRPRAYTGHAHPHDYRLEMRRTAAMTAPSSSGGRTRQCGYIGVPVVSAAHGG